VSQQSTSAADATSSPARTPAEIEAEIARTRDRLVTNVDQLQQRLSPGALAAVAKEKAVGVFKRPDGSLDPVRTGVTAGVVLILVVFVIRRRRL
jgi:hypothetical protein